MDFRLGAAASAAGHRLTVHDSLGSTNTEALEQARAGEGGPLWVVAVKQEAGRGRRGNAWASLPENLTASLLLGVDDVDPSVIATLGFVAGVALVETLDCVGMEPQEARSAFSPPHPHPEVPARSGGLEGALQDPPSELEASFEAAVAAPQDEDVVGKIRRSGPTARLKWPNDVLVDRAKLAGILLEAETLPNGRRCVVIGIGVNVAAAPEGLPYPATCLRQCGHGASAEAVFEAISGSLADAVELWDRGRGFAAIRARWLGRAAGLGEPVSVRIGRQTVQGIFETIDEAGRLVVRSDDGMRRTVTAGEVHFGTAATAA